MGGPAIQVDQLGKKYRLGPAHWTLIDTVGEWWSRSAAAPRQAPFDELEFWALRDASFQVDQGEAVGIIGSNGAGKSTLLKLLSRITRPTEGRIVYRGRVGSLLEVGTGFHPQLSGRDNIYLSGAVLGMSRREIASKFDEIVDFSGIEAFLDTPVKRYSSGMYLRLGFAVAAYLDTDILLVDEVLAVGDAAFQKKCLSRMDEVARQGRTVLFVSHNLTAIRSLCPRAILVEKGRIASDGPVDQVLGHYVGGDQTEGGRIRSWPTAALSESAPVRMLCAEVTPVSGGATDPIDTNSAFAIAWDYVSTCDGQSIVPAITLQNEQGLLLLDQASWDPPRPLPAGRYRTRCIIPADLLNDGTYLVSIRFHCGETVLADFPNVLRVEVLDGQGGRHNWYGKWEGVIRPRLDWITSRLAGAGQAGPDCRKT